MSFVNTMLDRIGDWLAGRLEEESSGYHPFTPSDPLTLQRVLQPGDVVLVEGNQKIAAAIKYLTQSTWSHSAIYVGNVLEPPEDGQDPNTLVEVNLGEGCVAVPLSKYKTYNTRICRPVGLTLEDRKTVVQFMVDRIGNEYDTRKILDLARELVEHSSDGLRRIAEVDGLDSDERVFLDPLLVQIEKGKSPGEEIAERWRGEWGRDRRRLIEATRY